MGLGTNVAIKTGVWALIIAYKPEINEQGKRAIIIRFRGDFIATCSSQVKVDTVLTF